MCFLPFTSIIATASDGQAGLFDATITSDQEDYYIYENVTATFNFSSHITDEDYFVFAIAENVSFDSISQSESVPGNFSVSHIYSFSLIAQNYSFPGQECTLYLLLFYYNGLFGDEICCYEPITIHRANLMCVVPSNLTEIEVNIMYNLTFTFYTFENSSFNLEKEEVICWIIFDESIYDTFTRTTDNSGSVHIQIQPDKQTQHCEIHLVINSSKYFNFLDVVFQLNILNVQTKGMNTLIVITISCLSILISAGFVHYSILFYRKKIKRNYKIGELKI